MTKLLKHLTVLLFSVLMIIPVFAADDLEETLESLVSDNAKGYLGPGGTAFGTAMNSGIFRTAKPHSFLGFDFTINIVAAQIPDADKTYDFAIPDIAFTYNYLGQDVNIALNPDDFYAADRTAYNLFGKKQSKEIAADQSAATAAVITQIATATGASEADIQTNAGTDIASVVGVAVPDIATPPGFNFSYMPAVIPQFAVGLPFDIEVMLRGGLEADLGDAGKFSFMGYGAKVGLNQFIPVQIPLMPRLSAGYYMTNMKIGDILESTNSILSLQASKSLPFITVYAGYGLESSTLDVSYNYLDADDNPTAVEFSLDGKNESRMTVGGRLKLAMLSINADYNIGEYNSYNLGIGITLR